MKISCYIIITATIRFVSCECSFKFYIRTKRKYIHQHETCERILPVFHWQFTVCPSNKRIVRPKRHLNPVVIKKISYIAGISCTGCYRFFRSNLVVGFRSMSGIGSLFFVLQRTRTYKTCSRQLLLSHLKST